MDDIKRVSRPDGVAGLKKHKMKSIQIAFLLFCLVAAGAFGIEDMLPGSGPGLTVIMLMVFAVVWAHPISQIVSELSALMPSEGGIYVWVKEALGEFWGFCMGWWGTVFPVYVLYVVKFFALFSCGSCVVDYAQRNVGLHGKKSAVQIRKRKHLVSDKKIPVGSIERIFFEFTYLIFLISIFFIETPKLQCCPFVRFQIVFHVRSSQDP